MAKATKNIADQAATTPVVEETAPTVEETTAQVVEETAPPVEETTPPVEETTPPVEETAPPAPAYPILHSTKYDAFNGAVEIWEDESIYLVKQVRKAVSIDAATLEEATELQTAFVNDTAF